MKKLLLTGAACVVMAAMSGCANVGADAVRSTRPQYNEAIKQTNDQDLLLNLLRVRYVESMYFMSVEKVALTREVDQNYGLTGNKLSVENRTAYPGTVSSSNSALANAVTRGLTLPVSVAVDEKPTIFYAPIEGEKFVRQILTPMSPDKLLLQVKSGWSIAKVFGLGVEHLNGLLNDPDLSDDSYLKFRQAVTLLERLHKKHMMSFSTVQSTSKDSNGNDHMVLHIQDTTMPEFVQLARLLALDPGTQDFKLCNAATYVDDKTIAFSTRSLESAIYYLSHGVDLTSFESVDRATFLNGEGWKSFQDDVFRVSFSQEPPRNASVAVNYRGGWFYIADQDKNTKATFVLLTQLLSLHSVQGAPGPNFSFSIGQ